MQLTQRQCFTPAALGQQRRWARCGGSSCPASLPVGCASPHNTCAAQLAARRAPSYTCHCRRRWCHAQAWLLSQTAHMLLPATFRSEIQV